MLTDQRIARAESLVVPITYSSRLESGLVEPSHLSLMAFDAACYIAERDEADLMVIAGEQTYRVPSTTTSEALRRHAPPNVPAVAILSDACNRLINTAYQAEALASATNDEQAITVVGWEFHRERVMQNLNAYGVSSATYITADSVVDGLWKTAELWRGDRDKMMHDFSDRYGFVVDWQHIKDHALADFAKREKRTMLGQRLGKKGWAYKLGSQILRGGRYDDISTDGEAIMERTK